MRKIFSTFSYQKKVNILSCLMISFLCAFVFLTPAVQVSRAEDEETKEFNAGNELNDYSEWVSGKVSSTIQNQSEEENKKFMYSSGTNCFYKAYDLLNGPFNKVFAIVDKDKGGVMSIVQSYLTDSIPDDKKITSGADTGALTGTGLQEDFKVAVNFLTVLGAGWMLIIAMTRMFTSLEQGKDPQEVAYKAILEVCIAGIIILELPAALKWLQELGDAALSYFSTAFIDADSNDYDEKCKAAQDLLIAMDPDISDWEDVNDKSWASLIMWDLSMSAKFGVVNICCWICELIMQVIVLAYYTEFGIRKMFAPVAVADIYAEGMRSTGMRFLKKMFAIYLKIAICMVSCAIGYKIMQFALIANKLLLANMEDGINTMSVFLTIIVGTVVAITMMTKGAGIADEALGV